MLIRTLNDLASAVKGRRKELGLSQGALAARAGVSRPWVYTFEAGKPTAEVGALLRVLDALGYTLEVRPSEPRVAADTDLDALLRGQMDDG